MEQETCRGRLFCCRGRTPWKKEEGKKERIKKKKGLNLRSKSQLEGKFRMGLHLRVCLVGVTVTNHNPRNPMGLIRRRGWESLMYLIVE